MMLLGLALRFVPFFGPLSVLFGFLPRLLHLRKVQKASEHLGEPFPVQQQTEIDSHTIRTKMAAYRLGMGVSLAAAGVCGLQWASNDRYKDNYKIERDNAQREYEVANAAARAYRTQYEIARNDLNAMKAQVSEASLKREGQIATKTKAKIKRVTNEAKLPVTSPVDASEWLRVESVSREASSGADSVPAPGNASGL